MFDLGRLRLRDTIECAAHVRKLGAQVAGIEEASARLSRFFYEVLLDGTTSRPACALARVYMTYPFQKLDAARRTFAASLAGGPLAPDTVCMSLAGTAGDLAAWGAPESSRGHLAIPLASRAFLDRLPMIAALVDQLGLDRDDVVRPDPARFSSASRRTYDVFFVPDAAASPVIPAKDEFVAPFGIRSVIGFGGALPSGQLLAVVLFSRVRIRPEVANMFRLLALSVRIMMAPFVDRTLFLASPAPQEVAP
jgi:hypothetical protein